MSRCSTEYIVCNAPLFLSLLFSSPVAPDVTADRVGLVDVPLGGTLELSCSILGVPPPNNISWTHNGTELLDMPPDVTIENTDTSTTLTVSDVEEDEGGVYQSTAGNVVNENSATTNVRIQCELYSVCV